MLSRALAVLDDPQWRELFGPDALAEVPLAATVGEQVIAGTADRLLVTESRIMVADFKTARRPPASLEQVPVSTLKQMGAYAAALVGDLSRPSRSRRRFCTRKPRASSPFRQRFWPLHHPSAKADLGAG